MQWKSPPLFLLFLVSQFPFLKSLFCKSFRKTSLIFTMNMTILANTWIDRLILCILYYRNTGLNPLLARKRKCQDKSPADCAQAHTFHQVHQLAMPVLSVLGPYAFRDPVLMVKLVRLAKTFVTKVCGTYSIIIEHRKSTLFLLRPRLN